MTADTLTRSAPSRPGSGMDPRLAARRVEVTRQQGRRRLRRLLAVLLVLSLALVAVTAVRSPLLDVDTVTITGLGRTDPVVARRRTGIDRGRAMISVDPAAAEARLERLPWVANAQVQRNWPATVTVRIVERQAVAVVDDERNAHVVDRAGAVLGSATAADVDRLPRLSGTAPAVGALVSPARRQVIATLSAMPRELRGQVAAARAGPGGSIFTLRDAITVRWGDARQARAKVEALRTVLAQVPRFTIAAIDVSVPTAAAITNKTGGDK